MQPPETNDHRPPTRKYLCIFPALHPTPTILAPRHGYTARRRGEAGSAIAIRERRKPASEWPAENGLPPATRGKRRASNRAFRFTSERRAGRACAAHKGAGMADASALSAGMGSSGEVRLSVRRRQDARLRMKKRNRSSPGNRQKRSSGPALAERPRSRAKPLNGARKASRGPFCETTGTQTLLRQAKRPPLRTAFS